MATNKAHAAATTRTVRVGGASINVTEWGAGPPVLLLHGNPDSGVMWDNIASRLGASFRCVAPDLPGFGHSEVPDGYAPSLDGMATFVEQFLNAADVPRPLDVIAHDFGGPFAFAWAVKHPDAVRRMVTMNTVFFSDYTWHFWARVWRTPVLGEIAMAAMLKPMFAQELRRGSRALPEAHIEATWAMMTPRMKKEVLRLYRANKPANFTSWERDFLALTKTKPTLVIWATRTLTSRRTSPSASTRKRSCTFRSATGRRSKRRRSVRRRSRIFWRRSGGLGEGVTRRAFYSIIRWLFYLRFVNGSPKPIRLI
jgi:pimeloyl-ACP methyl ester carboxylesterase